MSLAYPVGPAQKADVVLKPAVEDEAGPDDAKAEAVDLSRVVFTPVAAPRPCFDLSDFLTWHDSRWPLPAERPGYLSVYWRTSAAKPFGGSWDEEFWGRFPGIVIAITELPFEFIYSVQFLEQVAEIPPHRESRTPGIKYLDPTLEPCNYRSWIVNTELDRTFYFAKAGWKAFPRYPDPNGWWCFNNKIARHASHMPSSRKIIMVVQGKLIPHAHWALIRRSVAQHAEYVVSAP